MKQGARNGQKYLDSTGGVTADCNALNDMDRPKIPSMPNNPLDELVGIEVPDVKRTTRKAAVE